MDKLEPSIGDHSDSDSGESWVLLENNSNSESEQELPEVSHKTEENLNTIEKDDDTDGISIISESEAESCEIIENEENIFTNNSTETQVQNFVNPEIETNEEIDDAYDDLIGDSRGKLKTYVHRRNRKLSSVLNMVVLLSVTTAAGVAIGHMWGVRDDCAQQSSSSINKILSNLYKLQEENAFLRYKIKELALMTGIQNFKRKGDFDKIFPIQPKCKKVFEESLTNKNVKSTKCVDPEIWNDYMEYFTFDRNSLIDLNKIRTLYKQNKSRLDNEASSVSVNDELALDKNKNIQEANKWVAQMKLKYNKKEQSLNVEKFKNNEIIDHIEVKENEKHINENYINNDSINPKLEDLPSYPSMLFESNIDEIVGQKNTRIKRDKKKKPKTETEKNKKLLHCNKKNRKDKLKEKNKEERKLKGENGYDDLYFSNYVENHLYNKNNYPKLNKIVNEVEETYDTKPTLEFESKSDLRQNNKEPNDHDSWYEKRARYRTESRNKVIGEYILNNANWYFRRMHKREQVRTKPDSSIYRKASKNNIMNKTKK